MSANKRITFAVTIYWISRGVAILSNLFLIPILFRYLGKEELGLWFLLSSSQFFLALLGMGIAPTLTRQIALEKGKSGADPDIKLTEGTKQAIGDWIVTGRVILRWLALATFLVASLCGYGLLRSINVSEVPSQTVFWAWIFMCGGYAIGVWVSYLNCWLVGIGYVGWDNLIGTVLSILTVLVNIGTVVLGGGLLELAIISVVASLLQRFIILGFIRWRKPELFEFQGKWNTEYAKALVKPSFKCWLTELGAFSLYKTDQYFISLFAGVSQVALYQSTYSIVFNLAMISLTYTGASSVFISQFWASGRLDLIHNLVVKYWRLGFFIVISGATFLVFAGKEFSELWLNGSFIGYPILIILLISLTLDTQQGLLTTASRATEDEKYALSGISGGLLNLLFTGFLIQRIGLIGVPIGTLLAQLLTNNWYGVYRPLKRLKFAIKKYIQYVIFPVVLYTIFNIVLVLSFKILAIKTLGISSFYICLLVALGCVLSFLIALVIVEKKTYKRPVF